MNSSGSRNARIRTRARADALQHVGVRSGAHRQVVLAGETERLVVVRLEEQAGVVDLEDVDLGEVAVQRPRVGNRVHAVERMRDVDDPVLLADRGDRVREAQAAGDLALQEEPDHLALASVFTSSPGITISSTALRVVDGLERAAEDVVVGDGDRAEPFRLRVVDELGRVDRAVVRPRGVHVQVGDRSMAGRRAGRPCVARAPARRRASCRGASSSRGHLREVAVRLGVRARRARFAPRGAVVVGEPRRRCRGELGLQLDAVRTCDRAARRRRLECHAPQAGDPGHEDRSGVEERARVSRVAGGAHVHPAGERTRDRGAADQRARAEEHELPAGQLVQRRGARLVRLCARSGAARRTIVFRFSAGAKSSVSTPGESRR